jgi:hypothetical protein
MNNEETVSVQVRPYEAKGLEEFSAKIGMPVEKILEAILPNLEVCPVLNDDITVEELQSAMNRLRNNTVDGIRKIRRFKKTEMRLNVTASSYGILAQAGIVLGCSPAKALEYYVNCGDMLCEWSNTGFPL